MAYVVDRCPMCAAPLTSDAPVQTCRYCGARLVKSGGRFETAGGEQVDGPTLAAPETPPFVTAARPAAPRPAVGHSWLGWLSAIVAGLVFGVIAVWTLLGLAAEGLAVNIWPTLIAYLLVPGLFLGQRLLERRSRMIPPTGRTLGSAVGLFLLLVAWCVVAFIIFLFFLGEKTGPAPEALAAYVLLVLAPGIWLRERLLPAGRTP